VRVFGKASSPYTNPKTVLWVREKSGHQELRQDDFLPLLYRKILAGSFTKIPSEQKAQAWIKAIANNTSQGLVNKERRRRAIASASIALASDQLRYYPSPIEIIINLEDEIKAEAKAKREGKDYPLTRKQVAKAKANRKYELNNKDKKTLTRQILRDGYAPHSLSKNLCKVLEKRSLTDVTNEELKLIGRLSKSSIINEHLDDLIFQRSA
jgi:hypothetical protein